jgi:uracil-DNA glycosylase
MELSRFFSESWYRVLKSYVESDDFADVGRQIALERKSKTVYPERKDDTLFKVFRVVPFESVKVVVLGQDPYAEGSYDGLAFSNREERVNPSPSLRNILKEVENDVYNGFKLNQSISLYRWAEQGVLLLNTAHTVVQGSPGSHLSLWRDFTTKVVESINMGLNDVIWLLWGSHAHQYDKLITNRSHVIIKTGHPSPLNTSNPFKNCKCFSKCNEELAKKGQETIIW